MSSYQKKDGLLATNDSTDLTTGPVARTLVSFSLPFMVGTLLQTLYSTVDTAVVGQYLGSAGLSAVSGGSQIMQVVYMLCIGFINAGQVLIAQFVGARRDADVRKVVGTLLPVTLGISILLGLLCVVSCDLLLDLMNTPPEAMGYARDYVVISGWGMVLTGLYNMLSAIYRGVGDSRHPLLFVAIASVINVVLDIVFVAVFEWGVAGTAWATLIGQACSVALGLLHITRRIGRHHPPARLEEPRLDPATAASLARIGLPMALQSCAIQLSFFFVSSQVNTLGVAVSAAFGVSVKIRNIPTVLTQGLALGGSSMDGQNLGAKKYDRVRETTRCGIAICTVISIVFGVLFVAAPEACFRVFTQDPEVLALAPMAMFTLAVSMPTRCVMSACEALIEAQGFASFLLVISLIDAFAGRVFFCWLFGTALGMGAFGMFLGYNLATYLTAIPVFAYYASGLWLRREQRTSLAA